MKHWFHICIVLLWAATLIEVGMIAWGARFSVTALNVKDFREDPAVFVQNRWTGESFFCFAGITVHEEGTPCPR